MKKLKVVTVVGTRPEIIKLSLVMAELDKYTEHILVHSGQNYDYELNEVFFNDLGIRKPDYFLEAVGEDVYDTIGQIISKSGKLFKAQKPDAVLFYGDTNTCLAVIAAKKERIPVFHMEAGNRCFDHRVPEEINRKILDHLSDINLPLTEHARRLLEREGLPPNHIIKSGSTMREVLNHHKNSIESSDVLSRLDLKAQDFFIVSAHREENVDSKDKLTAFLECLDTLAAHYNKRIIVSTHPRTRKRLDELGEFESNPLISFMKPLGFFDYVKLQKEAFCVVSDSGTITEESSILNFPAITIREAHERPEGMDAGVLVMTGVNPERVLQGVEMVTSQFYGQDQKRDLEVDDYQETNVSHKVARIITSYVDFINQKTWFKES